MDKGVVDKAGETELYVTFLAGTFRSIRFGLEEAHGKGMVRSEIIVDNGKALQFNFLMDEGGFEYHAKEGTFSVNLDKIKPAVKKLCDVILTLQAEGSKEKAKQLLDTYGVNRDYAISALKKIEHLPTDIAPIFPSIP